MHQFELEDHLNQLLCPRPVRDVAPNGLQVQGKTNIQRILTGVTASQALIDVGICSKVDAILVHHGLFWKGDPYPVIGMKRNRLQALLTHDINLYAYHLPLDIHPTLGNNAQFAKLFDFQDLLAHTIDGIDHLLWQGKLPQALTLSKFEIMICDILARQPLTIDGRHNPNTPIQSIAWCTGAAQNYLDQAISLGVDVFLSGEISERTTHIAKENQIIYMACGHHATERCGIEALGKHLNHTFALDINFVDIDNPV